jgi:ABC-type glycerol-3-phosphate transport system permease component
MKIGHFTGIAFAISTALAFNVAMLTAACDPGMGPFVGALAPLLLLNPVIAVVVIALSALAAIGLERLRQRVHNTWWLCIVAALFATVPVTAIATFDVASSLGVHPRPGNCVI